MDWYSDMYSGMYCPQCGYPMYPTTPTATSPTVAAGDPPLWGGWGGWGGWGRRWGWGWDRFFPHFPFFRRPWGWW